MSQEKVDKYKAEKANRKKNVAKEKRKKKIYTALGVLLGVVFVAWIGISVFLEIKADKENESQMAAYSSMIQEMLEQQATATTSGSTTTTGTGETTTGSEDETTSGDVTTSGTETTSQEETTTSATE